MLQQWSSSQSPPDVSWTPFSSSLTTTVFSQRSMRRFEASPRRAAPKGQPSSLVQHRIKNPYLHVGLLSAFVTHRAGLFGQCAAFLGHGEYAVLGMLEHHLGHDSRGQLEMGAGVRPLGLPCPQVPARRSAAQAWLSVAWSWWSCFVSCFSGPRGGAGSAQHVVV